LKPYLGRFLIKADLYQIGVYPVRYSETRHAEVAKRTFRFRDNAQAQPPVWSGSGKLVD
jgi:hypothetical protein